MKKLLFLQLLILANTGAFAQSWLPVGATWHYDQTVADSATGNFYTSFYKMTVIKDTLISGDEYKIVERNMGSCDLRPVRVFLKESSNILTMLNDDMISVDTLINLNKNVGDSWVIRPSSLFPNDSIVVTVLGKGQKIINGDTLEAMKISTSSDNWHFSQSDSIVEKIGFYPGFFFPQYKSCDFMTGLLRCYEDVHLGVFETGIRNYCEEEIVVGIQSSENPLSFFPNPVLSSINIQLESNPTDYSIEIFNMEGQLILKHEPFENPCQIDFSRVQQGVYFITIQNKRTGELRCEKIVRY